MADFNDLVGKTITLVDGFDINSEQIVITCSDGSRYIMYHAQSCCECVSIEDIVGDVGDIIGTPILRAECRTQDYAPDGAEYNDDENLWTFYELATIKGSVTIRWYGSSNGYYSVDVTFNRITPSH
jgi:hypothetical protein